LGAANASNAEVGHFTVQAKQTTIFPLADLQGDPEMRNAFLVSSDAAPGEIAANLASTVVGDSEREVELLGKDSQEPTNAGFHPWSLSNGDDSTLFLFNHTAEAQRATVKVSSLWEKDVTLSPFETRAVGLRTLIQTGVPDSHGRILPGDITDGQISWSVESFGKVKGRLLLRNNANHMARNYSCAGEVVMCSAAINPTSASLAVGNSASFTGSAGSCIGLSVFDCSGATYGGWAAIYSWNSSGSSISSPNCPGSASCSVSAIAVGSSSLTFQAQSQYCIKTATANVTVKPPCPTSLTVDQITPKSLPDYDHPTWLTGVGILARMKAGPAGKDCTGAVLLEAVTPTTNSCPSNIQQYTKFPTITTANNSPFTVGSSAAWEGSNFPSILNDFYDSHKIIVGIYVLGQTSVQSCVAKATQKYYCSGSLVGTFTLTNTYTRGTINGQAVTNVSTTKQ